MIRWNDEPALGSRPLDAHHEKLLANVERLYKALRAGQKEQALAHLHALISASAERFLCEEELMAEVNYPNAALHTEHHGEMLVQLERFFTRVLSEDFAQPEDVLAFLTGWLASHSMTFDQDFAEFIGRA